MNLRINNSPTFWSVWNLCKVHIGLLLVFFFFSISFSSCICSFLLSCHHFFLFLNFFSNFLFVFLFWSIFKIWFASISDARWKVMDPHHWIDIVVAITDERVELNCFFFFCFFSSYSFSSFLFLFLFRLRLRLLLLLLLLLLLPPAPSPALLFFFQLFLSTSISPHFIHYICYTFAVAVVTEVCLSLVANWRTPVLLRKISKNLDWIFGCMKRWERILPEYFEYDPGNSVWNASPFYELFLATIYSIDWFL